MLALSNKLNLTSIGENALPKAAIVANDGRVFDFSEDDADSVHSFIKKFEMSRLIHTDKEKYYHHIDKSL